MTPCTAVLAGTLSKSHTSRSCSQSTSTLGTFSKPEFAISMEESSGRFSQRLPFVHRSYKQSAQISPFLRYCASIQDIAALVQSLRQLEAISGSDAIPIRENPLADPDSQS